MPTKKPARKTLAKSTRTPANGKPSNHQRTYTLVDTRLEKPELQIEQVRRNGQFRYVVHGDFTAAPPPIRDSKYLNQKQCIEIYRWMLLNRRMESVLENLYKQGKVVGGVYFGLGQEGCSCASAYALKKDEWLAPLIRNQGSILVRGVPASDIMMQYMAKSDSPTHGRDANIRTATPMGHNLRFTLRVGAHCSQATMAPRTKGNVILVP